jgi:hypothetical protein
MEEPLKAIPSLEREGGVTILRDAKGIVRRKFDYTSIGFGRRLAEAASCFFAFRYGSLVIESQSIAWKSCKRLAEAIATSNGCAIQRLPKDAISKLRDLLVERGIRANAAQVQVNICVQFVEWCLRNEPLVVAKGAITTVPTLYERLPKTSRPAISEHLVKKVLAACYEDIEETETRIGLGRRLLDDGAKPTDSEQARAMHQLLVATGGSIPLRKGLTRRLALLVHAAGGLREITSYFRITASRLFPFYLAILAQTGANPMALRKLKRGCINSHPLVTHLERVAWDKPRAGREQYVDFPSGKAWSAPNIIRRLMALNDPLVKVAHASDQEYLFLFQKAGASGASLPCWGSLHILLESFIAKHGLENFDLAGFRTHVGKAHHVAAGSIDAAKERLNHSQVRTTVGYTPLNDRASFHDQQIIAFQGRLLREARGEQTRWEGRLLAKKCRPQETLFGFHCADPYEGLLPGSVPGKLCLHFSKCATCPGALIPLDNVRVVAKLLATLQHLQVTASRAKKEGWWARYCEVYKPTQEILLKELLPAVSDAVLTKAKNFVLTESLPHLE